MCRRDLLVDVSRDLLVDVSRDLIINVSRYLRDIRVELTKDR